MSGLEINTKKLGEIYKEWRGNESCYDNGRPVFEADELLDFAQFCLKHEANVFQRAGSQINTEKQIKKKIKKMEKEMKCYNVIFEGSKKNYLYLAEEANSSDSGYIGKWLITPEGKRIKILSIVFYPKKEIDGLPYILKKINLAELSTSEEISVVQKEEEAKSVEMVKDIFRDMGIIL